MEIEKIANELPKPLDKELLMKKFQEKFNFSVDRKVFYNKEICIRFSSAKTGYSNTFLGLQKLITYNNIPILACIIRENYCEFMLANLTFIKCVSHSSKNLTLDNIRGSVNLSNIAKCFNGFENSPHNFNQLYKWHESKEKSDNISRIISANLNIEPTKEKILFSKAQTDNIKNAIGFYKEFEKSTDFKTIKSHLESRIEAKKSEIFKAAKIDNVNTRGNAIEQLITLGGNRHDLGDFYRKIGDIEVVIDIKSKLLKLSSAPKGYNIDKLLEALACGKFYFGYFFVGIDTDSMSIKPVLLSFLDSNLIDNTAVQHHWAGRNTRGVTQISGALDQFFQFGYSSTIDAEKALDFINRLLTL